jgi:dTDP-4-dehydrorhamnose 3,5-epimerase
MTPIAVDLINGKRHTDARGALISFNELNLKPIRRQYIIEHIDTEIVRAWQGHQHEQKWFQVLSGKFIMVVVKIDDWINPSPYLKCEEFELDLSNPQILHVPGGYATGFRAIEPNSRMMVFSDYDLQESANDDFRFDKKLWFKW